MKRIKWPLIILGIIIFSLTIFGSVFFPELTVGKIGILEPLAYSSFAHKIRKRFQQDQNGSFIMSKFSLSDSEEHEVKPLDKQQIQKMAEQLIPSDLRPEGKKGKIALSSPNEKIMKDFQEHLNRELPKNWIISRSTSNIDAVITGSLFNLKPPPKAPSAENKFPPLPIEGITDFEDRNVPLPAENKEQPIEDNKKPRRALFLYLIMETHANAKKVLSATGNYNNINITVACEGLTRNLIAKNLIDAEKPLKVAVINSNTSNLVTASILEKMVNAKTGLTFLDKSATGLYDAELKKALQSNYNQKVSRDHLAKRFSKSTGANAALIINQTTGGHFYLELMELPSLDVLVIGRSEDRSEEQLQ